MSDICRLCLSHRLVNNFIFDEDNKIYLKILSCLPVKVTRDDILPKKICDMCSIKVDDFYQFCHKSIDAENRLLLSSAESNATDPGDMIVQHDNKIYQFTSNFLQIHTNGYTINNASTLRAEPKCFTSSSTQTDDSSKGIECNIKLEPNPINEDEFYNLKDPDHYDNDFSDRDIEEKCGKMEMANEEVVQPMKKIEKISSNDNSKTTGKRKSTRKNKKDKSLKVKIKTKKSKFAVVSDFKSDDSEEDVSLVDIMKKDKGGGVKLEGEIVLKEIKTELLDEVSLLDRREVNVNNTFNNLQREEWNCCVCFMKCYDKDEMLTHYRSHYSMKHVEEFDVTPEVTQNENGELVEFYMCSHCNDKCDTKTSYIRHMRSHGLDKPYRCSLCEKTFRNTNEILKHGKNAHKYDSDLPETAGKLEGEEGGPMRSTKRFMCDLCDETFVYMKYVQIHRNLNHPEARERQFVNRCLHCGREFAHLNSLRRHLRSHSGERNFLCYICGKSLSSREHLKFHIRIHTGFKPHICKTCGKGFVKKCNLTLHERVHSGEKPHVCSHCGKAFSQRSTLVIHERYHSGARPYVCSICNKGFVAKGLLSMHLKTSCI